MRDYEEATMEREIHRTEEVTDTVIICDDCGLEAEHHLIPKEKALSRLADLEAEILEALGDLDAPDVPSPRYETRHRTESAFQHLGYMGYGAVGTVPATGPASRRVTERHYDGIDTDEKELIEKAEDLEEYRETVVDALEDVLREVRGVGEDSWLSDPIDLCSRCYEDRYGWGE